MTPTILFYILIGILSLSFLINKSLDYLNAQHFEDDIPKELIDIYDTEAYQKSQDYKKINYEFSNITDTFSIVVTLAFFFLNGFRYLDDFVKSISQNSTIVTLLFFGIIMIGCDLLSIPFSYYRTFVIEEQFGFNKTNKRTFFLD